jgi:phospholipid/cholesterol/gamma-HCH transport system substrate-binding protein
MSDRYKNAAIGIFIVAAVVATIVVILFLEPSIGDGKEIIKVKFSNVAGVSVGTQVTLAGKAIGEVKKIDVVKNSRTGKTDELGRVYFYQLELKVDSSVQVFSSDEIVIQTTGLLGEKSIGIIPKAAKKGVIAKNITKTVIYGDSIEPLENAIYQLGQLSEKIEEMVANVDDWFVENSDEISDAVKSFGNAMKEIDIALETVNNNGLLSNIKEAAETFTQNMYLIQNALEEVQRKEMIGKVDSVLDNSINITDDIAIASKNISQGKGTIGKLINNDDLYLNLTAIMSKVDTMMNDINHYGFMFQYDKHWQRIRTKRANLLNALNTPSEFKNYYENEVDDITTSLARISMLIDKAQGEDKKKVLESECFSHDFATLLRKVEEMLDTLKLYNEQLYEDKKVCE